METLVQSCPDGDSESRLIQSATPARPESGSKVVHFKQAKHFEYDSKSYFEYHPSCLLVFEMTFQTEELDSSLLVHRCKLFSYSQLFGISWAWFDDQEA